MTRELDYCTVFVKEVKCETVKIKSNDNYLLEFIQVEIANRVK